jgi:hypothetical protein
MRRQFYEVNLKAFYLLKLLSFSKDLHPLVRQNRTICADDLHIQFFQKTVNTSKISLRNIKCTPFTLNKNSDYNYEILF